MEFERKATINASADKVWKIIGTDFNDISEWASPVLESHAIPNLPEGSGRVCNVEGAGKVIEALFEYDDKKQALAFTLDGEKNPFFFKRVENHWRVEPKGDNQSVAYFGVKIELLPVFKQLLSGRLKSKLQVRADHFVGELKYFAENDRAKARN